MSRLSPVDVVTKRDSAQAVQGDAKGRSVGLSFALKSIREAKCRSSHAKHCDIKLMSECSHLGSFPPCYSTGGRSAAAPLDILSQGWGFAPLAPLREPPGPQFPS